MKSLKQLPYLIFTFLIFALLTVNFVAETLTVFHSSLNISLQSDVLYLFGSTAYFLWENFSFVLTSVIIIVNHSNLEKMNIDKSFLILYIIAGITFGKYYFWPAGWLALLLVGLIVYMLLKDKFNFENRVSQNITMIGFVLITAFCLYWLFKIRFIGTPAIDLYIELFLTGLPFWIIEEVIFRGLLWMGLETFGWRRFIIVLIQALLFWIVHIQYIFSNPFLFWLQVPIFGVCLGLLVWKYKSISLSSIAHILFNLR